MKYKIVPALLGAIYSVLSSVSVALAQPEEPYDPIEDINREIFWFNNQLDEYVLEPVAQGYRDVMPDVVRQGVINFFLNLRYPAYLFSDLCQGKFEQAWDHTGRFVINSTIGIGGLIDFAEDMGLPDHEEDFGITLASWGVPAGPYLMLPILGPSNIRDGVGRIVDAGLDPIFWVSYTNLPGSTKVAISMGALGIKLVSTRAGLLQAVEAAKESSVDYYLFMQGAYYQHRYGLLMDGRDDDPYDSLSGEGDDLYDPSEEDLARMKKAGEMPQTGAEASNGANPIGGE
jgi:phospholipid-binding lipoprotein MlaA